MAKAQVKENTEEKESFVDELKPGTKLMHGQYTIENFLNAGGFGITYLARDSLDRKIVIKECFPGAFCRRSRYVVQARSRAHQNELKSIVRLFVQEARSLAKLDHPNIVGVHQVFEDNDTAYMALDFVEGRDLLDTIEDPNNSLTPVQIKSILKEVLGAVGFIHDQGILHRDISPDNILINKEFHPVLIDFGAAREEATKQSRVLSALRVVKDGYSPQEFYIAGSEQSPSSDLYALAASFHHLITGDVPPNSQARLAAIASGEPDPYEKISGRYPDYDDDFLEAMDKALAVLPKDRVQSAKDWIQMMDGDQGNVTPLNVASAGVAEAAAPAAVAAKSKMPLLLGSAAVVALLVGVGVFTMSGGEDAPSTQTPVAVPETTAAVTPPAQPTVEPAQPVVEEAPAEVVEAPTVVVTEEAPVITETAPAPVGAEPVIAEQAATGQDPVVAAVEEALEPAVAAAPEGSPVVVEGPEIIDTATPDVRPTVRPDAVALEVVPEPVPLPEPVETPRPVADATVETAALPDQTANRPAGASSTPELTLPATPDVVTSVGEGPEVDIVAVTPGNEVVPEVSAVDTSWRVLLPFTSAGESSNIIAEAGPVSPVWVEPGLAITGINGVAVEAISDISSVLRELTPESALAPTLSVTFETLNPASGEALSRQWILPVVQDLTLLDGTRFETSYAGSGWQTKVASTGEIQESGFREGDIISQFIPTSELVDDRNTLLDIFERELANGTEQFTFAVQRNGSLWVASHTYTGEAE